MRLLDFESIRGGKIPGSYHQPKDRKRFLVFSDLHAHRWQPSSERDRFEDVMLVLDYICVCIDKFEPDYLVFVGDLFEAKYSLKSSCVARTYAEIVKLISFHQSTAYAKWARQQRKFYPRGSKNISVLFVSGNHDAIVNNRKDNTPLGVPPISSTLDPFSKLEGVEVVPHNHVKDVVFDGVVARVITYPVPGYNVVSLRAGDIEVKKGKITPTLIPITFSHAPMMGIPFSPTVKHREQSHPIKAKEFRGVTIQGHYHHPAEYDRVKRNLFNDKEVIVIGSPMAHDWSDLDAPNNRGCLIADVSTTGMAVSTFKVVFSSLPVFCSDPANARPGIDFFLPPLESEEETTPEVRVRSEEFKRTYDLSHALKTFLESQYNSWAISKGEMLRALEVGNPLMGNQGD